MTNRIKKVRDFFVDKKNNVKKEVINCSRNVSTFVGNAKQNLRSAVKSTKEKILPQRYVACVETTGEVAYFAMEENNSFINRIENNLLAYKDKIKSFLTLGKERTVLKTKEMIAVCKKDLDTFFMYHPKMYRYAYRLASVLDMGLEKVLPLIELIKIAVLFVYYSIGDACISLSDIIKRKWHDVFAIYLKMKEKTKDIKEVVRYNLKRFAYRMGLLAYLSSFVATTYLHDSTLDAAISGQVAQEATDDSVLDIPIHDNTSAIVNEAQQIIDNAKERTEEEKQRQLIIAMRAYEEQKRIGLIEYNITKYCDFFNLDVATVLMLARRETDNYKINLAEIIPNGNIELEDVETAAMLFVYHLQKGNLDIDLVNPETGKNYLLKTSDMIVKGGIDENNEMLMQNGETYSQFLGRVCDALGVDKYYALAISFHESGCVTSPLARNKNNFGGINSKSGYVSFSSPEAGIISYVMNLKKYEKYNFVSLEDMSGLYVTGVRGNVSPHWCDRVRWFRNNILKNEEHYFGSENPNLKEQNSNSLTASRTLTLSQGLDKIL